MSPPPAVSWLAANRSHLTVALAEVKTLLRARTDGLQPKPADEGAPPRPFENAAAAAVAADGDPPTLALDTLCRAFGLSVFERQVLLLCAGIELDSAFGPLCAAAQGDANRPFPTFSLALMVFPESHWSALTPEAALRRWRLLEVGASPALTLAPLRIDERILHHLVGVSHTDERLAALTEPVPTIAPGHLAPSHLELARRVAAAWTQFHGSGGLPLVQLCGLHPGDCRAVAAGAAALAGLRVMALPADLIPTAATELDALLRIWEREAALAGVVLLVEGDGAAAVTPGGEDARGRGAGLARFAERVGGPVIVAAREPQAFALRPCLNFDVPPPKLEEQRTLWREALGPTAADGGAIDGLAAQFSLGFAAIRAVAAEALATAAASPERDVVQAAWDGCRVRCRGRLDALAQRLQPAATWDDLVLPPHQQESLRQIAAHVRHRTTVYETWGFASKSTRGLGIAALFAGASGTGKTLAAEVLAHELGLDLYRIDLASMVSKYIGETEKNLRKVFDAAEASGAILLFDEADALFGKRSEVKDSHDRYANIEVSYLLQRVEAYRGLAILTTNLKSALDPAFLRRLRFVIQFPFPDAPQRLEIWRRVFPAGTPLDRLDLRKLANLNVAGGNIRNVALHAAFQAADAGEPVRMDHLREAARHEYGKLERSPTEAEIRDWT